MKDYKSDLEQIYTVAKVISKVIIAILKIQWQILARKMSKNFGRSKIKNFYLKFYEKIKS